MVNKKKKLTNDVNKKIKARFAEYMKVSRAQVSMWDKAERIVMEGKFVLVKESIELLRKTGSLSGFANGSHAATKRGDETSQEKSFEDLETEVSETQLDLETKNAKDLFENSRALREKATALQAAADYDKSIGLLVSRELVEKIMFERARACRDLLITSARRMSPLLAGKTDISEIESLLNEEYRALLENFARMPIIE